MLNSTVSDLFSRTRSKPLPDWASEFDCQSWAQFFLKWIVAHPAVVCAIPATGKPVSIPYIDEWRLENGKAVENWVRLDMLGLMQQLGVIPSPEQAPA